MNKMIKNKKLLFFTIPIIAILFFFIFRSDSSTINGVIVSHEIQAVPMNSFDDIVFFVKKIFHGIISILIFIILACILWLPFKSDFMDKFIPGWGEILIGTISMFTIDSENKLVSDASKIVLFFYVLRMLILILVMAIFLSPLYVPYIYYTKVVFGKFGKEGIYAIREARTYWEEYGQSDENYADIVKIKTTPIIERDIENDDFGYSLNELQGFNLEVKIKNSKKPLVYSEALCDVVIGEKKLSFLEPILTWEEDAIFTSGNSNISLNFPYENYIRYRSQNKISKGRIGSGTNYSINCSLLSTYHKDKVLSPSKHIDLTLQNKQNSILIKNNYKDSIDEIEVKCLSRVKYSDKYAVNTQVFKFEDNMVLPSGRYKTIKSKQSINSDGEKTGIDFSSSRECVIIDFD